MFLLQDDVFKAIFCTLKEGQSAWAASQRCGVPYAVLKPIFAHVTADLGIKESIKDAILLYVTFPHLSLVLDLESVSVLFRTRRQTPNPDSLEEDLRRMHALPTGHATFDNVEVPSSWWQFPKREFTLSPKTDCWVLET